MLTNGVKALSLFLLAILSIYMPSYLVPTSSTIFQNANAQPNSTFNPSDYYPCFQPCSYDISIGNQTYAIDYQIWNESGNTTALAQVDSISADLEKKSLLVRVTSDNNGTLILYIPKEVLNTEQDGREFGLLIDGKTVYYDGERAYEPQWAEEFDYRQLLVRLDGNTKEIEIIGERMIPEFGSTLAFIIGAISIGSLVALGKYFRFQGSNQRFKPCTSSQTRHSDHKTP